MGDWSAAAAPSQIEAGDQNLDLAEMEEATMNEKSASHLRQLARDYIAGNEDIDDAWVMFREEANASYNAKNDGSHKDYSAEAVRIFEAEKLAAFSDEQFSQTLVEQIVDAMGIYTGTPDHERFVPQAEQLLRSFEASEGHPAVDYLEIEQWSRRYLDPSGKFLVLPGGMQVKPLTKK
jgi:hypothetical protein